MDFIEQIVRPKEEYGFVIGEAKSNQLHRSGIVKASCNLILNRLDAFTLPRVITVLNGLKSL